MKERGLELLWLNGLTPAGFEIETLESTDFNPDHSATERMTYDVPTIAHKQALYSARVAYIHRCSTAS